MQSFGVPCSGAMQVQVPCSAADSGELEAKTRLSAAHYGRRPPPRVGWVLGLEPAQKNVERPTLEPMRRCPERPARVLGSSAAIWRYFMPSSALQHETYSLQRGA